jgi:hypothetical protein
MLVLSQDTQKRSGAFFTGYAANSVTAIPEPESYAMMLAGLGLLDFMARRRKGIEIAAT